MPTILIKNISVIKLDEILTNHAVLVENEKIKKVAPENEISEHRADQVIDGKGNLLSPGFIDLHIHGVRDKLIDGGPEHLVSICKILPQYGVTGFLPSVTPLPQGDDTAFLSSMASVQSKGTAILGFFLEGPFLALTGALGPEAIKNKTRERAISLIDAAKPHKTIFAISPDVEEILELIPLMKAGDTPVFMTHTAANAEQTIAAIEAGACHATHFYDVFPCPEIKDPGVRPCGAVEAILADPGVSVDFILDGEHVEPIAVKMALQCKGPDHVCLITDANIGAGLPPGKYKGINGHEIGFAYEGAPARGTEKSPWLGMLAGSGLTLDMAVRNAIKMLDVDLPLAVRMASANPARVLGLAHKKGEIKQGYDADLVLLDKELRVLNTWVNGKLCYSKE